ATVQRTMAYLRSLDVQAGDRVALQLPKCLPFIYLHLAIMRLGAITLPLNPAYPEAELHYFLEDSGAKVFFADSADEAKIQQIASKLPALQEVVYLKPEDTGHFDSLLTAKAENLPAIPQDENLTAIIFYTSGTTGRPKGAQI